MELLEKGLSPLLGGKPAQKAPISVISETQEWQHTAPGLPAGPGEEGLGAGTTAYAGDPTTLRGVGEGDRRRGAMWPLRPALLFEARGRGAAGLSRGRALRAVDAPLLGNKFLRAGRMVPEARRMGVVRKAGMG